jgi:predicted lipase
MNCCNNKINQKSILLNKNIIYKILRLSYLCDFSYSHKNNLKYNPILDNLIYTSIFIENKDTDAQCYIVYSDVTIYIIFRGTSSFKDACIDLSINQINFFEKDIYIHKGFYKQFISISDQINTHITNLLYLFPTLNKICFTGHSLGGGLATIASCYFKQLFNNFYILKDLEIECFTFGSPRVGNKKFTIFFNKLIKTSYRIVHDSDPIQYFPMTPYFYTHITDSLCIINKNEIIIKKKIKNCRCINSFKKFNYFNIIKPHRLETYISFFNNLND